MYFIYLMEKKILFYNGLKYRKTAYFGSNKCRSELLLIKHLNS